MSQFKNQGYAILEQSRMLSNYNGKPVYTIEFVGIDDKKIYKTYIQPNNRNFQQWAYIVERPDTGLVVKFHNFKLKREEQGLISADSVPKIEIEADYNQLMIELNEYWKIEDKKTGNPVLDSLFEI
jgi:hypothetical protein